MPPRLNKRQQRELEELEALGGQSNVELSSEDEAPITVVAGFSALIAPEGGDDESGDEKPTKSRKSKKKKKKATEATTPAPPSPDNVESTKSPRKTPPKNEKKALKKAKAREKKAGNDELTQALAELSIKYPDLQKVANATPNPSIGSTQSFADLLSVSLAHLDSEAEMRKFFGSKIVQANKSKPSSSGPSGSSRRGGAQRSHLTRPQPTWWAAKQREGLSMRILTEEELEQKLSRQGWGPMEEKWWTVEYSKKYKSMTKSFMRTVMSGDPQGFWDLLGKMPWHADTLLQLSEVYRHREEYAQAVDFVDRALFTYERSFIGAFNFTSGLNRLDFDHVENRPFFLAIHRQITDLYRRGCVRTSFEFARLLYSLDPWNDPHGALFHLDFLSLKAGMNEWFLDVFELFTTRHLEQDARMDPTVLPGWAYTKALALRMVEDAKKDQEHQASTAALKEAIESFPSIVPLLADKIEVSLPAAIRSHHDFKIETDASGLSTPEAILHLLSHLYAQRSFQVWKEPAHSAWFVSTVVTATFSSVLPITKRRQGFLTLYTHKNLQYAVYRHIMVLETSYRRLFSFLPRQVLEKKSLACDPLPPPTPVTEYDESFFSGIDDMFALRSRTRQERVADERHLERLIPDAAFRQQLQAFFEGNPAIAQRFPGGMLQFAQMVGQLPEDVLEDMMLVEAMRGEQAQGMPGEMPGFADGDEDVQDQLGGAEDMVDNGDVEDDMNEDEDDDDDEDEDEDEDEDISPMPRVLRNILGRFWGRSAVVEESSDEDEPLDPAGVD